MYAQIIMTQLGGPDGELGASMRYLNQRYSMPYNTVKGALTDIGIDAIKTTVSRNMLTTRYKNERGILFTDASLHVSYLLFIIANSARFVNHRRERSHVFVKITEFFEDLAPR